jgi:hypothetical protein
MISFGTVFFKKGTEFYFTYDRVLHWQKYALEKSKKEEEEDTFKYCKDLPAVFIIGNGNLKTLNKRALGQLKQHADSISFAHFTHPR